MRLETADRLKGLCIALMIVGHCQISSGLHDFIYLFHIPLFFFVSGFFMKAGPAGALEKTALDGRRLLVPYLLGIGLVTLKYGIDAFRLGDASSLIRYEASALFVGPFEMLFGWKDLMVGPLWFLIALFWGRCFMNFAVRKTEGPWIAMAVGFVVCSLPYGNLLPFGLQQGLAALAFLGLGNLFGSHRNVLEKRWMWIVSVALTVPSFFIPSLDMYEGLYPVPVANALCSCGAIVFLWKLFYLVEKNAFPLFRLLSFFGRISLLVLIVHYYEALTFDWYAKLSMLPLWAIPLIRLAVDFGVAAVLYRIFAVRKILCLK